MIKVTVCYYSLTGKHEIKNPNPDQMALVIELMQQGVVLEIIANWATEMLHIVHAIEGDFFILEYKFRNPLYPYYAVLCYPQLVPEGTEEMDTIDFMLSNGQVDDLRVFCTVPASTALEALQLFITEGIPPRGGKFEPYANIYVSQYRPDNDF